MVRRNETKDKGKLELWTFTLSNVCSGVVPLCLLFLLPSGLHQPIISNPLFLPSSPATCSSPSCSRHVLWWGLASLSLSSCAPSIYIPHHNPSTPHSSIQMQSLTMKEFLCQANQQSLCSLLPPSGPNQSQGFIKPSKMMVVVQRRKRHNGFAVGCASWSLEAEMKQQQQEEEVEEEKQRIGMGKFRHKCEEEGKGLVDLLECLEREAIMGEDAGKEPLDYNRRAQIFDRSSRVFQALRQHDGASVSSPQQSSA